MDEERKYIAVKKRTLYFAAIVVAAILVGGLLAYAFASNGSNKRNATGAAAFEPFSGDEIYPMFLCPCCGEPLDKNNICCGMAKEMIEFIDARIAEGLSKEEVIIKTAEAYGINSVIESKRAEVEEKIAKLNPGLPTDKISFSGAVGKKAPEFSLEDVNGKAIKLSDYKGKIVVLFFNEGSMCYPACWDQIAALASEERFGSDAVALSIVVDQQSTWKQIMEKMPKLADATILFDTTRGVSSAYDVLNLPSSMHPGAYPGHTYMVIDKEGIIRYVYDDPKMAIRNDIIVSEVNKLR